MKSNIELIFPLSHQFLSNFVITPIINIGIKQEENQKANFNHKSFDKAHIQKKSNHRHCE